MYPLLTTEGHLQGTPLTHLDNRHRHGVSARQFGAKGDGAADDTAALQAWLNDPAPHKVLPGGVYRVTTGLTCTLPGVTILGPGTLRGATAELILLTITGDDTTVDGVRFDGANTARTGIRATGANHTIQHCVMHDLRSTTNTARGIDSSTNGAVTIRGNHIRNVVAVGDATNGNNNGMSRGISLHTTDHRTAPALCVGNQIDNIAGEESDAIITLNSNAVSSADAYEQGWTLITGNMVRNVGRRHIKVQGSDVWVDGNWCWNTPGFVQENPSNALAVIQGHRVRITNNIVKEAGNTGALSIVGPSTTDRVVGVEVSGNHFTEGDTTSPVIYLSHADQLTITGNTLNGGSVYVSAGTCADLVVAGNTCRGGVTTNDSFTLTSSVTGKVRYNTIPTGRAVGTSTNVVFTGNG